MPTAERMAVALAKSRLVKNQGHVDVVFVYHALILMMWVSWILRCSLSSISPVSCIFFLYGNQFLIIHGMLGTAVYVFCIQPLGVATSPQQPSLMNLTFSLDNVPASPFIHQGSSSASGFAAGVNVFFKQGLMDGPHTLRANLAPNSVFILDYVLVTRNVADNSA
jgi:hypothetical protein